MSPAPTLLRPTWVPVQETGDSPRGAVTGAQILEGPVLHGALELPVTGTASSAVLIVEPVGREQATTVGALAALSRELSLRGALTLRISLRGTGNSHPAGADAAEQWAADVCAGLRELHRRAPGVPLRALGLRVGAAALLAACAESAELLPERAVLWEPVGGRAYLRRAASLRRFSVPRPVAPSAAGTETPGMLWSPGQADSLRGLPDPLSAPGLPAGWSVRQEADRAVAEALWDVGPEFALIPREAVEELAQQLSAASDGASSSVRVDARPLSEAVLRQGSGQVLERLVTVADGRPGILAQPASGAGAGAETAVQFVAASSEPLEGPTGLWAACARDLAGRGIVSLRAERPGCGILTDPDAAEVAVPYDREVLRAVRADARWLRQRTGLPVTAVGLCVGAWLALVAARSGATERIIAINNVAWRPGTAYYRLIYSERSTWDGAPRISAPVPEAEDAAPGRAPVRLLRRALTGARRLAGQGKALAERSAPAPARHVLGLLGVANAVSSVLVRTGGPREIDLVFGAEDHESFLTDHGPWGVAAARRLGRRVTVRSVPILDHALLAASARTEVLTMLPDLLGRGRDDGDRRAGASSRIPSDADPGGSGARS